MEVDNSATASADIVLHRVSATGSIQVNLRLDDGTLDTLHGYDTIPLLHYPDSLYRNDSLLRHDPPPYDTLPRMDLDSLRHQDSLYRRDSLRLADTLRYQWNPFLVPKDP